MARLTQIWEQMIYHDDNCPMWYFEFPVELRDKETSGDLDVIYTCLPEHNEQVIEKLKDAFQTRGFKKNGNCTSIEWEDLQIDMIYTPDLATMEWAANWYSHGDFMALVGRVFRYYHFVFKNNGLYFTVKSKNFKEELFLTLDWNRALTLLQYPVINRYQTYYEADVYEYVFSSPLAFPGIYNDVKPERPLKRPMQLRFYEWLADKGNTRKYERNFGWTLLKQYDKKAYQQARLIQMRLSLKEFFMPVKRVYKKVWNKTLKPRWYKLLGKDLSGGRSKRNVRN